MKKIKSLFVVVLLLIAIADIFEALDQPFPVYGYIKDSNGNPLPSGVDIIIKDVTKSTQISVKTQQNGYYQANLYDLPNCENGDKIEIYCAYNGEENSKSFVLDTTQPSKNVSFSLIGKPSIKTLNAINITSSSARLRGNLTDLGGDDSCLVWFEYGETKSYGKITNKLNLNSVGVFTIKISNLKPYKTYHFRAVAKNSKKTSYGKDLTFKTLAELPQVNTYQATNVGYDVATLNGYLSNVGEEKCQVWFVYDKNYHSDWKDYIYSTPKMELRKASSFYYKISGLEVNETYHFRAVASNIKGTVAGEDLTFTTHIIYPSIKTLNAINITSSSARLRGNLTDLGGDDSCLVWFEYGETKSYGKITNKLNLKSVGEFSIYINELKPGKTYHFRAVAKNYKGISYGADVTFSTQSTKANVKTSGIEYAIILKGNLTDLGGDDSCLVWFEYWEEGGNISQTEKKEINQVGEFEEAITGLKENTTYYYRAVVENSNGISYGANLTFKTISLPSPPIVITINASAFYHNATLFGNISSFGGSSFCYVWFEYWENEKYSTSVKLVNKTGLFKANIYELEDGKKYYYKIVAVGSNGRIAYGKTKNFTTLFEENHPPNITILYPKNGSVVGINISLEVYVEDFDGDLLNVTFYWENGSKIFSVITYGGYVGAALHLHYGKEYFWYVTVSDGKNVTITKIYSFYTIENVSVDFYNTFLFENETAFFYDNSSGNIVYWRWDFGDNSIAYGKNVSHIYQEAGMYNVTLIVTDEFGNNFSIKRKVMVYERGDANLDGEINAIDITKIKRIIAGLDSAIQTADVDKNGLINDEDLEHLINKILGLE